MELEKTLYRVHDRLLFNTNASKIVLIAMTFLLSVGMCGLVMFMILNNTKDGQSICTNFANDNRSIDNQTLFNVSIQNNEEYLLVMQIASIKELITMNEDIRQSHNFTVQNVTIQYECYDPNWVSSFAILGTNIETLFINDLVSTMDTDIYVRNYRTNETWFWSEKTLDKYKKLENPAVRALNCFLLISKILIGLFIQSAVASLYIKMTIICSPVFIVLMIDCMTICGNREVQPAVLARAFPWIGGYLNILDRNQRSKKQLLFAFAWMLLLFYFVYLSCVYVGTFLLFLKSIPNGLDEDFFGLMAIIEFSTMLFLRTRSSLYFVPKYIMIYYLGFIFYVQQSCYGFFYLAFKITLSFSIGTICAFLYFFEIPALQWSPASPYTPTIERPRCFYSPVFQIGWNNDIPQIWSMFYPLHGRRFFQVQHLAFVDRNFPLLNNVLQQDLEQQQEVQGA